MCPRTTASAAGAGSSQRTCWSGRGGAHGAGGRWHQAPPAIGRSAAPPAAPRSPGRVHPPRNPSLTLNKHISLVSSPNAARARGLGGQLGTPRRSAGPSTPPNAYTWRRLGSGSAGAPQVHAQAAGRSRTEGGPAGGSLFAQGGCQNFGMICSRCGRRGGGHMKGVPCWRVKENALGQPGGTLPQIQVTDNLLQPAEGPRQAPAQAATAGFDCRNPSRAPRSSQPLPVAMRDTLRLSAERMRLQARRRCRHVPLPRRWRPPAEPTPNRLPSLPPCRPSWSPSLLG